MYKTKKKHHRTSCLLVPYLTPTHRDTKVLARQHACEWIFTCRSLRSGSYSRKGTFCVVNAAHSSTSLIPHHASTSSPSSGQPAKNDREKGIAMKGEVPLYSRTRRRQCAVQSNIASASMSQDADNMKYNPVSPKSLHQTPFSVRLYRRCCRI